MRILDMDGKEVKNPDLSVGYLIDDTTIKKNAKPIDNATKHAWDDSDYEEIKRYIVEPVEEKIETLKSKLRETDYVALKIAEGSATKKDYADILKQRQQWRDEINELEGEE